MANHNQGQDQGSARSGTQNRGFASMSDADQRAIARMGGTAVSENREHMAQIGRKGGEASAEARAMIRNAGQPAKSKSPSGGSASSAGQDRSDTGRSGYQSSAGRSVGSDDQA
jgi:general stress protein YciG